MPEQIANRLATALLTHYGPAETFEVDFMDRQMNDEVSEALKRLGCCIKRSALRASIQVTCAKGVCRHRQRA